MKLKEIEQYEDVDLSMRNWGHFMLPDGVDGYDIISMLPDSVPAPLGPVVIEDAKLCLTNFKYLAENSEETPCFSAEVCFEGEVVAVAANSGRGGATDLRHMAGCKEELSKAEAWARQLPVVSAYNHAYEQILDVFREDRGEPELTDEVIRNAWWLRTETMSLEYLTDQLVNNMITYDYWKGKMNRMVIIGPCARYGYKPLCLSFKEAPTYARLQILRAQEKCKWIARYSAYLNLPFHYYPSPHPFGTDYHRNLGEVIHLPTGNVGVVHHDTTDEKVVITMGGDLTDTLSDAPDKFKFVEGK